MYLLDIKRGSLVAICACTVVSMGEAVAQTNSGMPEAAARKNSETSHKSTQAYPYNSKFGWKTSSPQSMRSGQYGSDAFVVRPSGQAGQSRQDFWTAGEQGATVTQEKADHSLEEQGLWHRQSGMPASKGSPTQLAPGSYAAPPVPAGTVFANNGISPLTRPKSAKAPTRVSELYGMYPQNVIGTWLLENGGQWGMALEGTDKAHVQKYDWSSNTGAGLLSIAADGTWTLKFAGKTQTGRWADAPDTVHFFKLDGEEQFAYWNSKGQLELHSKSGKVKPSTRKHA